MSTNAMIGRGTSVEIGDDILADAVSFTEIGEPTGLDIPEDSQETVDVSHTQSPGLSKEFIAGLEEQDELSIEMNFTREDFAFLEGVKGEIRGIRITFPLRADETTASKLEFDAIISGPGGSIADGDKITQTLTLKPTGARTFEAGSGV